VSQVLRRRTIPDGLGREELAEALISGRGQSVQQCGPQCGVRGPARVER
jgi:hypothetical protein